MKKTITDYALSVGALILLPFATCVELMKPENRHRDFEAELRKFIREENKIQRNKLC